MRKKHPQTYSTGLQKERKKAVGTMRGMRDETWDGGVRLGKGGKEGETIVVYNFSVT